MTARSPSHRWHILFESAALMPLVYRNGKTIFFAHVPKAGGSSVEDYLIRRFGTMTIRERSSKDPKTKQRAGHGKRDIILATQHLSAADLTTLLPTDLDYSFALVRDPVDRILSEFRFQSGASRISRLGFSIWLRIVLSAAGAEPRIYENHIRPQSDLVPDGAEVFRLEDGFDGLTARLDAMTGETRPDLTVGHFLKKPRAQIAVFRQDVALIRAFYAVDYARFSYPDPDLSAYPQDAFGGLRGLVGWCIARTVVLRHWLKWIG